MGGKLIEVDGMVFAEEDSCHYCGGDSVVVIELEMNDPIAVCEDHREEFSEEMLHENGHWF